MASSPKLQAPPVGNAWPAVAITGLPLDALGNYLVSLGLLALSARKWPQTRAAWRDDNFILVHGPATESDLCQHLQSIAVANTWTPYERGWADAQKKDTKLKNAKKALFNLACWRSQANEDAIPLFDAHLVAATRSFNRLLGVGGNSGKRIFADGWRHATTKLAKPELQADLPAFLAGHPNHLIEKTLAASWFSQANKAYNSGTKRPSRDGAISPWAMALACEALPFFRGSTSRRLGARRGGGGTFPFIIDAAAPIHRGEFARRLAELWAPVWRRPMSFAEVEAVFSRARVAVGDHAAASPAAFAAAILQRGVDAGVVEFRRFTLLHTTSQQTFESRLEAVVPVPAAAASTAKTAQIALRIRDALPRDRTPDGKERFAGLRGPLDEALVQLAAHPGPSAARGLVDAIADRLRAADRNASHRDAEVHFRRLPGPWAQFLLEPHLSPTPEMRIGLALACLDPAPPIQDSKASSAPFLAYWLGARQRSLQTWVIPKPVPARRVWTTHSLVADSVAVLRRRLMEVPPDSEPPFQGAFTARLGDIEDLLLGQLDDAEINLWAVRFSVFDDPAPALAHRLAPPARPSPPLAAPLALYALLRACFDPQLCRLAAVAAEIKPVGAGRAAQIAALLARGDGQGATVSAVRALRAAGLPVANLAPIFHLPETTRLLATILVPVRPTELRKPLKRWLLPESNPRKV